MKPVNFKLNIYKNEKIALKSYSKHNEKLSRASLDPFLDIR